MRHTGSSDRRRRPYRSAPHAAALRELIDAHVSTINRRTRQRLVTSIAERVLERETSGEVFLEQTLGVRLATVTLHVAAILADIEARDEALARDFEQLSRLYGELRDERMKRAFLSSALRARATSKRQLRGDLAALRRDLGFDALRERNLAARHELLAELELGLDFIAGSLCEMHELGDEQANDLVRHSALLGMVLRRLARATRWPTRFAVARAASACVRLGMRPDTAGHQRLLAVFEADDEHPWARAEAVRVFWGYDEDLARQITTRALLHPTEGAGRSFLLRRLLVDVLAERPTVAHGLLPRLFEKPDPSAHVRIGVYRLVLRSSLEHPQLVSWLIRACHGPRADALACTRANATRLLIERLRAALVREDMATAERCVDTLGAMLRDDADELVLQLVCNDLAALWRSLGGHPHDVLWTAIVEGLTELCARDDRSAVVHECAAAALEVAASLYDPRRRELRQLLEAAVARTSPGERTRIPLRELGSVDPTLLGAVAAELARDDWDLDLDVRRRALVLYRGQRFARKPWRMLHELRHLSPNKRQGFLHSIGRRFSGLLRAHSGRLHEVTATTVPGERVHVENEGGWGRHVPSIDDLLSLPVLRRRSLRLFSSYGITTLVGARSLFVRLFAWLRMTWNYAALADERLRALASDEASERSAFTQRLRSEYGIEVSFEPHAPLAETPRNASWRVQSVFSPEAGARQSMLAPFAVPDAEWFDLQKHYFLDLEGNSQAALAVFLAVVCSWFVTDSFRRKLQIERARRKIPLCIGGWGTRGKSGTERLKAGLFHGLGYRVFSKTTGCEAMFIHSVPEAQAEEVFVFRPYSKATIWEQRDLLMLGSTLGCDVFLWECMALNPRYVEILSHLWMRDDIATITNTYPDHEDIQGPAGYNVAQTIAKFVPKRATLVTSEVNFLPMLRDACTANGSKFVALDDLEDKLLAPDLLELFPYQEHPRNIALVTKMAEELDIDRDLAIVTMAQHVVPDLGVLKTYPKVRVLGRDLQFINGCSANERTGFLNNWRRTGCDKLDPTQNPERVVVTVVNNRADRVSRSEVFARILVGDIACDRHVLIGTNIQGLMGYIEVALAEFLDALHLVNPRDADPLESARRRLAKLFGRVRIPEPSVNVALRRLEIFARGAGLALGATDALRERVQSELERDGAVSLVKVRASLDADDELRRALDDALVPDTPDVSLEVLDLPAKADVVEHFLRLLAKMTILARLDRQLAATTRDDEEREFAMDAFERRVREAYAELFRASLLPVWDADTTGDQIAVLCAREVPPGTHVTLMGTQNIKGTGLDFVYRWLSLDFALAALDDLRSARPQTRIDALARLEQHEDHGLMDLGHLRRALRDHQPLDPSEAAAYQRVLHKVEALYVKKRHDLERQQDAGSSMKRVALWLEGWVEFLDGAARFHRSRRIMRDLVDGRMSHPRAAVSMRELYAREKGGWLYKALARAQPRKRGS